MQTKKDEIADRELQAVRKAQKDKILEIIASKKDQQLQEMSVEELMKKFEELN